MDVRILTAPNDIRKAERQFRQIFRHGNAFDDPVQPWVPARALFYSSWAFGVVPEQFDALVHAARTLGDERTYICTTGWYGDEKMFDPRYAEIPLETGRLSEYVRKIYDASGWLPPASVNPAFFSLNGFWGILTEDEFAIAAGSKTFLAELGSALDLSRGLRDMLNTFTRDYRRFGGDASWIPRLLRHIYGPDEASRIISNSELPSVLDQ